MQNLQRSTSHTGVSNAQSWGFARSNTLHHVDRQGRGSQGDTSEKNQLITRDTLNSIFQAIKGLAVTTNGSPRSRVGVGKMFFDRAKELIFYSQSKVSKCTLKNFEKSKINVISRHMLNDFCTESKG